MEPRKVYLDSLCFVELALAASGRKEKLHEAGKFVWYLQALLRAARDGQIKAYSSILTIAECVHAAEKIDDEVQRLFRGMLTSGRSGLIPWQADIFVMERARDLRWKHDINLKPIDSVHVATALEATCHEFVTWDGIGTRKRQGILKAAPALAKLNLAVVTPDKTQCIPDGYRQGSTVEGNAGN